LGCGDQFPKKTAPETVYPLMFKPTFLLSRATGSAAREGLVILRGFHQFLIALLAPYQNGDQARPEI